MDLSIIIVNWNSKEYLKKCLDSIIESRCDIDFEIIVIDNASFDGCAEMLKQYFPQVRFFQSNRNLGFAKANNEAFKVSHGQSILFLNPDTEVEGGAISKLMQQFESKSDTGIAGAKLLNSDRTVQKNAVRVFPTIINQLFDTDALMQLFPRSSLWRLGPLLSKSNVPIQVDAISGACIMIKRSLFESVGMFSTDYFMYSEDIDLCYKVQQSGLKIYYVPSSIILHHGGCSSSKSDKNSFSNVMMVESRWRFFRKTRSIWYSQSYRLAMFTSSIFRTVFMLCLWPFLKLAAQDRWIRASLGKWLAILSWTFGREKWIKDF